MDAGHLKVQELVLRLAREAGFDRWFELPTKPSSPSRSADACLRNVRRRELLIVEVWNRIDDIGAAARTTTRKVAEAEGLAAALGGDDGPYRVGACWVVRGTRRNRQLVARYPEAFATRFPGSSRGWVKALIQGAKMPDQPGLVWSDVAGTRLFDWRRG